MYGGRITDTADMHVLMALLRRFVRPELLDETFSFAPDPAYSCPPGGGLNSYRYLKVFAAGHSVTQLILPDRQGPLHVPAVCSYLTE